MKSLKYEEVLISVLGKVRYKSPASGREVDWFLIGFSPRKANISMHLVLDIKKYADELKMPGKFKTGVGCLYINKLSDVNLTILKKLITAGAKKKIPDTSEKKNNNVSSF